MRTTIPVSRRYRRGALQARRCRLGGNQQTTGCARSPAACSCCFATYPGRPDHSPPSAGRRSMAVAGARLDEVETVVRAFQRDDRNFLLPPAPTSLSEGTVLDISHEALLRQWSCLPNGLIRSGGTPPNCGVGGSGRTVAQPRGLLNARDLSALVSGKNASHPSGRGVMFTNPPGQNRCPSWPASRTRASQMMRAVRLAVALLSLVTTAVRLWLTILARQSRTHAVIIASQLELPWSRAFPHDRRCRG